jgi:hypothetical protein
MKPDGQIIKELFLKSGITTQDEFAKLLGVQRNTIQIDFRCEKIKPRALYKYLTFFNISKMEFEELKYQSNSDLEDNEWRRIANEYKELYETLKREVAQLREIVAKYQTQNQ